MPGIHKPAHLTLAQEPLLLSQARMKLSPLIAPAQNPAKLTPSSQAAPEIPSPWRLPGLMKGDWGFPGPARSASGNPKEDSLSPSYLPLHLQCHLNT